MAYLATLSTNISMWGKEKSSLGLARFKSLKSTNIQTFISFFETTIILNTH
jgi:hypothetical protein